jgi:hypothetical protein
MRKQEYVHVHALLAEITQYMIEHEGMPAEQLSAYHERSTSPSSIHESKRNHHDAVMALSRAIELWVERELEETSDRPVTELP